MGELWQFAFVVLFCIILAEAFAILALGRAIGLIQLRIGPDVPALDSGEGLSVGSEVPPIAGLDLRSGEITTVSPDVGRWLLIFVSAACQSCRDLSSDAERVSRAGWEARFLLIAHSSHDQNEAIREVAPGTQIISDPDGAVHDAYAIKRVPAAMLVEDGRVVAKGIVNSRDQLELMLQTHRTRKLPAGDAWIRMSEQDIASQARTR